MISGMGVILPKGKMYHLFLSIITQNSFLLYSLSNSLEKEAVLTQENTY
jgi:hypothetical protein